MFLTIFTTNNKSEETLALANKLACVKNLQIIFSNISERNDAKYFLSKGGISVTDLPVCCLGDKFINDIGELINIEFPDDLEEDCVLERFPNGKSASRADQIIRDAIITDKNGQ